MILFRLRFLVNGGGMTAKRTTVSLAGDVLGRVERERLRLEVATKLEPSLSEVAISLVKEALDARDAARKKGAKS
jgi:hypothetical protein